MRSYRLGKVLGVITLTIIVVLLFWGYSQLSPLISKIFGFISNSNSGNSNSQGYATPSYTPQPSKPSNPTPQVPKPVIVSSSLNKWFGSATVLYSVRNNGASGWVTASVDLEVQYEDSNGFTRSYVKTRSDNFYIGSAQTLQRSVEFSLSNGEKAIGYGIDFY
jgi:hypothetical protein